MILSRATQPNLGRATRGRARARLVDPCLTCRSCSRFWADHAQTQPTQIQNPRRKSPKQQPPTTPRHPRTAHCKTARLTPYGLLACPVHGTSPAAKNYTPPFASNSPRRHQHSTLASSHESDRLCMENRPLRDNIPSTKNKKRRRPRVKSACFLPLRAPPSLAKFPWRGADLFGPTDVSRVVATGPNKPGCSAAD